MKIESTYNRIISVPLSITLRKVAGKFLYLLRKNKIRKNIYENQTYSALFDSKQANFFHYFSQPDKSLIKKYSSIIEKIGAKIFNHEYDILGSGWINVRSGYEAKGIEGCQFNPASPVFIDLDTLLPQLVGKNNIDYSKKVGSLIDKDYILHDWQLDFKSGYRWDSLKWHKELTYGYVKGADIKVAWEFGRMQNLPWLAYYAALEKFQGNLKSYESAAREFHNQILDFIAQNPPGFGVQWFVPMDVGIRAANWLVTFDMFHSLGFRFDKEFLTIFINSIYDHGLHIAANLEWSSGMRANHYFANICGLLFIAAYLPVSKQTSQWLLFALQELLNEIDFQFNSDGSNFEASTYYHRFTAEMALFAVSLVLSLAQKKIDEIKELNTPFKIGGRTTEPIHKQKFKIENNKIEFPSEFWDKLFKIVEFIEYSIDENGLMPQIGDNDDGRFLKLTPSFDMSNYDEGRLIKTKINEGNKSELSEITGDCRNVLSIFHAFCPEGNYQKYIEKQPFEYDIISRMINTSNIDIKSLSKKIHITKSGNNNINNSKIRSYPDFGLYVFKNEIYQVFIRCGSLGQNGKGGHAHNDQLSFCLNVVGKPIFADPGTYLYTPLWDMRNKYRSTFMHNTLSIEDKEQNKILSNTRDDLFWLRDIAKAQVIKFDDIEFIGAHYGYSSEHTRKIRFGNDSVIIEDICNAKGNKSVSLHFAPEIVLISKKNNHIIVSVNNLKYGITFDSGDCEIQDYLYAVSYGKLLSAKKILIKNFKNKLNCIIDLKDLVNI